MALLVDTFNGNFESENVLAAARLLTKAGYALHILEKRGRGLCCGRTYLAAGMVEAAREKLGALVDEAAGLAESGIAIVGLEPSCLLTLRDEALAMGLPVLASRVAPFSDLISSGIVIPVDSNAELQIALDGIRDGRLDLAADRKRRISYFMSELSFASNARRLREALELASANFPSTSPARLVILRKLAKALHDRFGMNILDFRDDGILHSRTEENV